jgi:predicted nucleic acid-binding protein
LPEEHAADARLLLGRSHDLLAPELLSIEFANALGMRMRRGEITERQARTLVRQVSPVVRTLPAHHFAPDALDLAIRYGCSAYDALYLVSAIYWAAIIVTADRDFYDAVGAAFPDKLLWVEDIPSN